MKINNVIYQVEEKCSAIFKQIDEVALFNQKKVLNAFAECKIAPRHFSATTGYGYDDVGRDTLNLLFAKVFSAEKALVSPLIASGTHAITLVLFGLLRPNDTMYSACGMPYDTLEDVILGKNVGSLADFGINFDYDDLKDGRFDLDKIKQKLKNDPKVVYLQRSRGYSWRNAFTINDLKQIISFIKNNSNSIVVVDNCYGEFVETLEPTDVGADVVVGSLIKNPGGGIVPTGGYIAGKEELIEQISYRLTAPSVGLEIGSYDASYKPFYQGLFMAPHVVAQAMKGARLFSEVYSSLGYETLPNADSVAGDIICSIKFNSDNELIEFCRAVQKASPIDSFVTPYPWDMPGYNHQVIMAAGTFVQGASIELSADSPIKKPYIAYVQGGLTYEHVKIAVNETLNSIKNC